MWWDAFIVSFVPLFIVMDAIGVLPLALSLSEGLSQKQRRKLVHMAALTAAVVGLAFLFFGQFIFRVMDISVGAVTVAGGIILLVLSVRYIVTGHLTEVVREEMVAVVPIGTPLLAGPATIATLLLLAGQQPLWVVLVAYVANLLVAWVILMLGNQIARLLGRGGLRAVSNVFNLLLAAIAVTMVIRGLAMLGIVDVVV